MQDLVELVWLIPALPLAGFMFLVAFGRRLGEPFAGWVATQIDTRVLLSRALENYPSLAVSLRYVAALTDVASHGHCGSFGLPNSIWTLHRSATRSVFRSASSYPANTAAIWSAVFRKN